MLPDLVPPGATARYSAAGGSAASSPSTASTRLVSTRPCSRSPLLTACSDMVGARTLSASIATSLSGWAWLMCGPLASPHSSAPKGSFGPPGGPPRAGHLLRRGSSAWGTPTQTCPFCPPSPEPALNPNRLLRCGWLAPTPRFPLVLTGPGTAWTNVHLLRSPVHPPSPGTCPFLSRRPPARLVPGFPARGSAPHAKCCILLQIAFATAPRPFKGTVTVFGCVPRNRLCSWAHDRILHFATCRHSLYTSPTVRTRPPGGGLPASGKPHAAPPGIACGGVPRVRRAWTVLR